MGLGNYAEDRVYKKVIRAQAGQDFSTGAQPKAVMLVGTNAEIHAFDQYGNGFTLDNLAKVGTTMYSVSVKTVDHVVEDSATRAYILF
tara:strand:- start:5109 stop:5372 length:264 start_codon:yes stop_codon:yes gene_type:complete